MVQVKEPFTFYTPERQRGGERGREERVRWTDWERRDGGQEEIQTIIGGKRE